MPARHEFSPSRRELLKLGCSVLVLPSRPILGRSSLWACQDAVGTATGTLVNDIHSQLNQTRVEAIVRPRSIDEVQALVLKAGAAGKAISIAGGRHAMGGQQFNTDGLLLDMTGINRVLGFDAENGLADVEAGIEWPALVEDLLRRQQGPPPHWGIVQKQTGADRLSIGGALSSNIHGRGLRLKPIIGDVEYFELVDHRGEIRRCSRQENAELFRLAIGGYGLFGVITSVRLRLAPRRKVQRIVKLIEIGELMPAFDERIAGGFEYGDFQFATEGKHDNFLRTGVFSCYRPVDPATPIPKGQTQFSPEDWARLTYYSHNHKRRAFEVYSRRYLETSGQIYWSDTHQMAAYVDNYHAELDRRLHARVKGTEMITELYVPRESLASFMWQAAQELRSRRANVIYGTIRLIEQDDESFLRWAARPYACVVLNLHVTHDPAGIGRAAGAFRGLIDLAVANQGSYYLTYHRFAERRQIEACYPQFRAFLGAKLQYDPAERFQSDWYRHHKAMFGIETSSRN